LILGDRHIRSQIEAGEPLPDIISGWEAPVAEYVEKSSQIHLYE
jgi:hypothetical protein